MNALEPLTKCVDPSDWLDRLIVQHQGNIQSASSQLIHEFKKLDHNSAKSVFRSISSTKSELAKSLIEKALVDGMAGIVWSPEIETYIYALADDSEWDVRESAQLALKSALEDNFDTVIEVVKMWIKDPNPNIRRAALVACRPTPHESIQNVECMLDVVEALVSDSAPYVKKNVPYVFRFFRRYPDQVLPRLLKLAHNNDVVTKSNLAQACEGTLARTHPQEVLGVLKVLAKEKKKPIPQLVLKALSRISKEHPDIFTAAMDEWAKDEVLTEIAQKAIEGVRND